MKQKLTRILKLALGALGLGAPLVAQATFAPVPVTGFNQDVVANGNRVTAVASSTYDVDANSAGYTFMEQGYTNASGTVATQGLPSNRIINSAALAGLTFRLGSYSANNVLRLPLTGQTGAASGTLTFATRMQANDVYLLVTGGNGAPTASVTVNFADGTSQAFTGLTVPDWFNNTPFALTGLGRVARTAASAITNDTGNPRLYQLKLTLSAANQAKLISSVTVAKTSTGNNVVNVFAVSVDGPACNVTPTGGTAAASMSSACSSTAIDLSMTGATSGAGTAYQWEALVAGSSTWADIAGADWPFYSLTNQANATSYRLRMTCSGVGTPAYSTTVLVAQNPFYNCYCVPTSDGTNEYIRSVAVNGSSGFTNTTNANAGGYGDYTTDPTLTTTLNKGGIYPLVVTVRANNSGSQGGLWIDYNHNSTFDDDEYSAFGASNLTGQAVTFTTVLIIPNLSSVRTGLTRMRVRWRNNAITGSAADACATGWAGEAEDYLITIGASTACTGTPPRVTATADQTTVCRNTPINLAMTGLTAGASGFSFQWQSAPAGSSSYTALGAVQTTPNYTVASQTVATDYRVIVTCTATSLSRTGTQVTVNQNDFTTCYCTPAHSSGCGTYASLLKVAIAGTTLNNASTCAASPYYTNVAAATATGSVSLGSTYTMSVILGRYSKAGLWIDYDHSGSFDASEYTVIGSNSGNVAGSTATATPTITIPSTALTGATRMRVRTQYFLTSSALTATDACTGFTYGETEDYTITLISPVACAGLPGASTATASATTVCAATSFTLDLAGIDPALTGLSYQWQSRPAGSGIYTNLGTAQPTPFYTVPSLTADTEYRAVVTCTNGGASSNSSPVTVAYTYLNCYCTPASGSGGEYITNLTMAGVTGFSSNSTNPATTPVGFSDYTTDASKTTTLYRGVPYVNGISLTVKSNNTNSQGGLWIDYDHSGTFESSENVFIVNSSASTLVTFPQNLTVPTSALTGPTRVRVRWRNGTFSDTPANLAAAPCLSGATTWYGETEDYVITIADAPTCTAPPATVTATASVSNACANSAFNLSTNSVPTTLGGYAFQWYSSPAGANTFTAITGATTNPYTVTSQTAATDYRLVVSCQFGGSPTTSNTVAVGQNSFDQCYCTTNSLNGCATYGSITNVSIGSINNTSACAASTYTVFAPSATTTTNLDMGLSTPLTLTVGGSNTYRYAVWIDFDHNGTFDASEYVANSTPIGTRPLTVSLAIPAASASVLSGATRMRVRTSAGITTYPNFGAGDACTVTYDGETEDYTVTLVPQTPCSGTPPTVAAAASVASACANASFTLSFPSPGNFTGLSYQWERSAAGANAFTAIGSATATTYTVSNQTAATDYRVVLTCANGGLSTTSTPVSVAQSATADCYCKPTSSSLDEYFTNVTLADINNTTGNSVASSISGYADYTTNPTATQTTALLRGNTYTISVTARDNRINSQALLFIDFNQNSTFEQTTPEYKVIGSGPTSSSTIFPQTLTFSTTFTVPAAAPMGLTRLRVRWHNDNNSTNPCATGWNGETEDYIINIIDTDLIVSTTLPIPAGAYNSITVTGTGNGTLAGVTSVATSLTVQSGGTFADGCQVLSGAGSFTAAPGSTLRICNPAGISASGSTGAVQVTGTRSFSPNASYEYNGTATQTTGNGLPATVLNLTVSNATNVALSQDLAVRHILTIASGDLNLGSSNLLLPSTDTLTAMVVNSGSGRVQNNGPGRATVQRTASPSTAYAGAGYRHYSSPVASTTVADLGVGSFAPIVNPAYNTLPTPVLPLAQFPNVFDYQESRLTATYSSFDAGWRSPAATTDVLTPGKGYTVNIAPQTVDLTGLLNTGAISTGALSHTGLPNSGWQLLGNPYPAPLDWSLVSSLPAGIDASVYVFEPNTRYGGFYRSFVNGLGTNTFNGILPAMQAFFIRNTQAVPAGFSFQNAYRLTSYANPTFHRGTGDGRPLLRLSLGSPAIVGTDETIVYLQAGATAAGTDTRFDAAKLPNSSGLSLASQMPGVASEALAINGLPLTAATADTHIPLVLAVPVAGTYHFNVNVLTNLDPAAAVLLLDHTLNTRTNLRQTTSYTFAASRAGALNGRFELLLGRPGTVTATAATLASQFSVWPNPATGKAALQVALEAPAKAATLTLRTVLGQVVHTQAFAGSQTTVPTTGLATGTYLLTVEAAGQAPATRRVVIE